MDKQLKMTLKTSGNLAFNNDQRKNNPTLIPRELMNNAVCAQYRTREVESSPTRSVLGPCETRQCSVLFKLR